MSKGASSSTTGLSQQAVEPVPVSPLRASIPSAEQADRLGSLLSHLDDHWATDTTRAAVIVMEWELMKERDSAAQ